MYWTHNAYCFDSLPFSHSHIKCACLCDTADSHNYVFMNVLCTLIQLNFRFVRKTKMRLAFGCHTVARILISHAELCHFNVFFSFWCWWEWIFALLSPLTGIVAAGPNRQKARANRIHTKQNDQTFLRSFVISTNNNSSRTKDKPKTENKITGPITRSAQRLFIRLPAVSASVVLCLYNSFLFYVLKCWQLILGFT